MASCAYVGRGKMYLDGRFVGNVSALNIAITENKIQQTDYTGPGGGNCATVSQIDAVEMSMTMTSYDADNLALAVFGTTSTVATSSITDEPMTSPATLDNDTLVLTAELIDTKQAVSVTSDPAGTTYTEGTDYTIGTAGITILAAGTIGPATALLVSYQVQGHNLVQALVSSAQEYEAVFDGLNEADSGAPVVVKGYKVKFGPAEDLALISEEFAELALTGDILKDETITGAGLSQYFTVASAG